MDQKIELIDQIWEEVRRTSVQHEVRSTHLKTLNERVKAVREDLSLALSPSEARAHLRK